MKRMGIKRMGMAAIIGLWGLLAICRAAGATERAAIPEGEGDFTLDLPGKTMIVNTYRPAAFTPDSPVWVVIHGARRRTRAEIARDYYDVWAPLAERYGALLVLPNFLEKAWPTSWRFQLGNARTPDGAAVPWEETGFAAVEKAFDKAVTATGSKRRRFSLFGHGAGAQWVQRYVLHGGGRLLDRAVAANPGWYMLPDDEFAYPYGLRGAPIAPDTLKSAFASDFILLQGQSDTSTTGIMRDNEETRAQGENRYERGKFYVARAKAAAAALGVPLAWRNADVPDAGHDDADMAPMAAHILATGEVPSGR